MSKNGYDNLFSNLSKKNEKNYENLKKAKVIKDKTFYIYKYFARDIKCIIYDKYRLVAEIDITYKRPVFRKRNANDIKSYYFVDEKLGVEKRQKVLVDDIVAFSTHTSNYLSYRKFNEANSLQITPSTITNILKKTDLFFSTKLFKSNFEKIFVSIDEMAINSSKNKFAHSYETVKVRKRKIKSAKVNTTNLVIFNVCNLVYESK